MSEETRFLEKFNKFKPSSDIGQLLKHAKVLNIDKTGDRARSVTVWFPAPVQKSIIYKIEEGLKKAYNLNGLMILTKYPKETFYEGYIHEVIRETERVGAVAKGFFSNYRLQVEDNTIKIYIPFGNGGLSLLDRAKTTQTIEGIIRSEFGLDYKVVLDKDNKFEVVFEQFEVEQTTELKAIYEKSDFQARSLPQNAQKQEPKPVLQLVNTLIDGDEETPDLGENERFSGCMKFDISNKELVYGKEFEIAGNTHIANIGEEKSVIALGEVFGTDISENRKGTRLIVSFAITDGNSSINVRKMLDINDEQAQNLKNVIKDGIVVAIKGKTSLNDDATDRILSFESIYIISKIKRTDAYEGDKRVELHLHTTMSAMDALIAPDVAVKTAHAWGWKAIAITDHGNVQAFPEAMLAAEKLGMKVIYGMEAYFVDDTARAFFGEGDQPLDGNFVVFDIETTGLSPSSCKITEIGAVKISGGKVIDRFETFVDPEMPIPKNITDLTGITDEMVKGAPKDFEAVKAFLDFADGSILIAHNATFDISFIRKVADDNRIPFTNAYLDTVALSRYVNPDLKNHKLDTIADYYRLGEFNHHRASDDAYMLANIFFCMVDKLKEEGIHSISEMNAAMSDTADPLKLPTYHMIILVKNQAGLKNLYKLVSRSYLDYYRRFPRIPKTVLEAHREGLIIGSACESGELYSAIVENKSFGELLKIVDFYDYLEIQPLSNNMFLVNEGRVESVEALKNINRQIIKLAERKGKPVVATCDAHFLDKSDEICRKILLAGMKYQDADRDIGLYLRTTEEMLKEFSYLGTEKAKEVVIKNTNLIADMVEDIRPIPKGTYTPSLQGAEEDLQEMCWKRAKEIYGEELPSIVKERLQRELDSIIKHGFAVLYVIASKLVKFSEENGYLVGSRGSVGSSFVATMAGISEVNPLPPHYYCKKCKYSDFNVDGKIGSGFDLEDKECPVCGTMLTGDGHDIPFETFLGFYGDKSPDIDLNFSGDVQAKVHKYTEDLFGAEKVFRAGTIGTLADKTAFGFVSKYVEDKGKNLNKAELNRLVQKCVGVKRTTGQHPGGIIVVPKEYEIYDFTPVQHPADDAGSGVITTHFAFSYLHDTILKLDELGHDIPTKYKMLETYTNTSVLDVPMNDRKIYELFLSPSPLGITKEDIDCEVGTFGLPEFGTKFVRQMIVDAKPKNFSDLLQVSGLSHGTDVWLGNADELIKSGVCDISNVIGTRDSIMLTLIKYGLEKSLAFTIMESVRKGKGLKPEWEKAMLENNVPQWYIDSCKKIKYMFPKAHAAAYVMSAIRLGWYKIYYPLEFYAAFFTVAPGGFDAEIVMKGRGAVKAKIDEIKQKIMDKTATPKDTELEPTLQLVNESMARGVKYLPVDLYRSDASAFIPENGGIRIPFNTLPGLGDTAAKNIVSVRDSEGTIFSKEELRQKAKLTKAVMEILEANHVLDGMNETNQITLF